MAAKVKKATISRIVGVEPWWGSGACGIGSASGGRASGTGYEFQLMMWRSESADAGLIVVRRL